MSNILGWGGRMRGLFTDTKGPWGSGGGGDPPAEDDKGSGPWGEPPKRRRGGITPGANVSSLDEWLRRGRARFGGGGGLPGRPDRSIVMWVVAVAVLLWLVGTSMHSISPGQRGVVSRFGRYSYTLGPGIGLTLPSPIDRVTKIDVESIRSVDIGSEANNDLMLTADQNLLDIAYSVRWNIRTPELYLFQLADPDETIKEVANSAMRSVISQVTLNDAMGDRRADIEGQVAENMQRVLDSYHSGIQVQGIAIKQADPPDAVNDAFKQVTAAQQQAQSAINSANCVCASVGAEGAGRRDRVRQGL